MRSEVFSEAEKRGHEQVSFFYFPEVGLKAVIAVHSTVLGPALGGCRMRPYLSESEAVEDVMRLAEGMTYKNAIAGLDLGGGKACIIADPRMTEGRSALFRAVIEKSVAMLGGQVQKKGVAVTRSLLAKDPVIECDEEQMTQVLLNLLMNGLQILGHGGRIEIVTSDDVQNIILEIADDGPGIQPEERSRIFEAFFFKREGGIGLGLVIVQQILVSHGGQIEASESKLGGALFRIRLPRKQSGEA